MDSLKNFARYAHSEKIGILEQWNNGILGLYSTALKNNTIHEIRRISWKEKTLIEGLKS